jgi:UDP-N-acetylmuramoyl-tripeptide--D-alanyl-D-alanine ligase
MEKPVPMKFIYDQFLKSTNICTDTRKVKEGCIFFALKGDRFDGNQFTELALASGASMVVTDDPSKKELDKHIFVNDSLIALQDLARMHRSSIHFPIIGITGSNGKTTTKELLLSVLSKKFKTFATTGNFNNHIGVPLTLLSIPLDTEIAIIEMGANHVGEIELLASIADPDSGVITSIGKAHLEGFGSIEGIANGKFELFKHVINKSGTIFYRDYDSMIVERVGIYSRSNVLRLTHLEINGRHVTFEIKRVVPEILIEVTSAENDIVTINSVLPGEYNATNILLAVMVGLHYNVALVDIADAISEYSPSNNRSQWISFKECKIFLDAYNANPTSMREAIHAFQEIDHPSKILVIGSMKELGEESTTEHRQLLDYISEFNWKAVFLFGEETIEADTDKKYFHFRDISLLKQALFETMDKDLVLVKGSRSNMLESLFVEH